MFTEANWTCISASLNQGQETVIPYGGVSTVLNAPNIFIYGTPNDNVATVSAANYFLPEYASLKVGDWILGNATDASFSLVVTASSSTSVTVVSTGLVASVGTANIINGAVTGPKLANPLDSVAGGFAFSTTTASATPGTVRSLKGLMIGTNAVMSSGNLVGARGEVDYVGASGGFVYGVQGKIIPTGTLSGSSWNAGVFGQLDISGATVNAGQMATLWGDYGATSGTLTNQTGLYGIAMTNTTAAVLQGQLYLYGGAQNLMLLNTNSGLSGVTYYKAAGTSAGSAGDAAHCAAQKVIKINIDGADAYIPVFTQNT